MTLLNVVATGFGLLFVLILMLFAIGCLVLWIYTLVDIIQAEFRDSNNKIVWILLVIFFPVLGMILYYIIGRQQKIGYETVSKEEEFV